MPTKNEKSNLRYKKSYNRHHKETYKGLSDVQKKYIKTLKRQQGIENEINLLYRRIKRLPNGAVDWDNLDDFTLSFWTDIHKLNERLSKQLRKFEDLIDVDRTFKDFMQTNTKSDSY